MCMHVWRLYDLDVSSASVVIIDTISAPSGRYGKLLQKKSYDSCPGFLVNRRALGKYSFAFSFLRLMQMMSLKQALPPVHPAVRIFKVAWDVAITSQRTLPALGGWDPLYVGMFLTWHLVLACYQQIWVLFS